MNTVNRIALRRLIAATGVAIFSLVAVACDSDDAADTTVAATNGAVTEVTVSVVPEIDPVKTGGDSVAAMNSPTIPGTNANRSKIPHVEMTYPHRFRDAYSVSAYSMVNSTKKNVSM